jgi:UDP-GlcNAc:undecaprenyl-phosphate GlcNAc-1-phosphate transferase
MLPLLLLFTTSCLLCCLLTPLAGSLAPPWGLVARPDARRKLHGRTVPVAGGLAVFLSGCIVLLLAFFFSKSLRQELESRSITLLGLLLSGGMICILGVLDDRSSLRGRHKLLGQMAAVGVVIFFGVRVERIELFDWPMHLGVLAIPFTMIWLLGAINALNLLDGMDGMLGCVGAIIALAMAGMALLSGNKAAACVAMTLAGALL